MLIDGILLLWAGLLGLLCLNIEAQGGCVLGDERCACGGGLVSEKGVDILYKLIVAALPIAGNRSINPTFN